MTEQNSLPRVEQSSPPVPVGGRSASFTRETASQPEATSLPIVPQSSGTEAPKNILTSPSKLHLSEAPYLARHFHIERDILREIGIQKVREIDSYILSLVKERQWVDTEDSYKSVLQEISKSLGLNEHLDLFARIDKLLMGTKLIKQQRFHEQMARALKTQIDNTKTK